MKDEAAKSSPSRSPESEAASRVSPDTEQLAAQMSALLADLVRTPESELADWSPSLRVGDRLGRFTLVRELGRGGMGVVWEAEDPDLSRRVALKVVRPGANARVRGQEWLQREAEAVARLSHPNIVTLFDFGLADSGPFLVFELLRGQPLDKRLRTGPLPFDSALAIAVETARALVHAHRAGVIHRDLKPANVYVSDAGDVKVLDFGLANLLGRTGPREGGTPAFMAPEQWRGELGDERTDLFALGVTLFAALTGAVPYPVKEGRSAVEEHGPTPRLPAGVAPARFRRLVERCLEREPAARPASSQAVLDELRALRRSLEGRGRRRALAGLTAAAVGATLVAGWLWWTQGPPPGERLTTVVADTDNQTGDPALDGLSGLLTTSLEPSRRLLLVPRARLLGMAREAKLGGAATLDQAASRQLARLASAQVLLLPAARREGQGLAIEIRALEPATDRVLFSLAESARGTAEVPAVLDRLSAASRRKLQERSDDLAAGHLALSSAVSPNLSAARAYYQGLDCLGQPAHQGTHPIFACAGFFEEALAHDPAFALAHFQLAIQYSFGGNGSAQVRPHLEAALRAIDRLPRREALLVRAWSSHLSGDDAAAARLVDEALAGFPDDGQALSEAGVLRLDGRDFAGAIPFLERKLALDPGDGSAQEDLVRALAMVDRRDELRRLVTRLQALPPTLETSRSIVRALGWLGDAAAAVATARQAGQLEGGDDARTLLADALGAAGAYDEAEPLLRQEVERAPGQPYGYWRLALALGAQGRLKEALDVLDASERRTRPASPSDPAYLQAMLLAGGGDGRALWRAAAMAQAISPEPTSDLSVILALRGDLPHAEEVARALPAGSGARAQYQALRTWRTGDPTAAAAQLAALEARDRYPEAGVAPAYLLAEVGAAAGDARATLAAVERYRRLWPLGFWRAWAWPRAHLLAARAHLALGDRAAARAELDRLLALWRRADAGMPLLAEARALRTRL